MARKLVVEIVGDARSLDRAFKKSSKSASTFGRSMEKTQTKTRRAFGGLSRGVVGLTAGFVGTAGLIGVARSAFAEFSEMQKVSAQTAAALKSTGGAAHVTAKEIDALADSMLKKTGIDDEAIKSSENMLLTFTKIRNEAGENNRIFDRATLAVADLATAMNQGAVPSADQMQQSAIRLGKALNDPVKGVTALSRVGIQFTDQQRDQIKALVESGKVMEAQKLILAELNTQVGGRAAAAGKTFAGQWRILTETLNNLTGVLAAKLMPTIQRYLEMAVRWLSNSQNQKKVIDAVTTAGHALKTALDTLVGAFKILSKIVGGNKNAIIALVAAYATFKAVQIASTVTNLASSFGLLATRTTAAKTASRGLTASFLGKAGLVAAVGIASFQITSMILKMTGLDKKLKDFGGSVFDIAASLGLVNDQMKQFEGKRILTPADVKALRKQAQAGMSIDQLTRAHPRLARRDIEVAVGARGERRPIHVNVQVDGKTIARATARHNENEAARRRKQRNHSRRVR